MGSGHQTDKDRFLTVLKINIIVFLAEFIVGLYSGSLSMISDGFCVSLHILVSLTALVSELKLWNSSQDKIRYWSAKINIILFFPLAASIGWEAYDRLKEPPVLTMTSIFFIVALMGLAANIYTARLLHGDPGEEISENRSIFYWHMLSDIVGSIIVITGATVMRLTEFYLLDPILSFILVSLIVAGAIRMSFKSYARHTP